MTRQISQRELRNDTDAILRAVESGEVFLVTRDGTACAELRPFRRRFVAKAELLATAERLMPIGAAACRAEVDQVVDQPRAQLPIPEPGAGLDSLIAVVEV
ncbi:MAG: type II toxin-antitoxin system Phd/YefM family antitoxin [Nocardioides sp.]